MTMQDDTTMRDDGWRANFKLKVCPLSFFIIDYFFLLTKGLLASYYDDNAGYTNDDTGWQLLRT